MLNFGTARRDQIEPMGAAQTFAAADNVLGHGKKH